MEKQREKTNGYVSGALILAASNVICRFLGFVFRIPLANLIGAEGMGYYSFAHQILNVVSAAAFAGFAPALVQRIAAAADSERLPILSSARKLFTWTGMAATLVLMVFGGLICRLAGAAESEIAVLVLAPTALLSAWEAAYRAYFQGIGNLRVPSAAQTADAFCKLLTGTAAAFWLHRQGCPPQIVAAGAVLGVTLGTIVSAAILARGVHGPLPVPNASLAKQTRSVLLKTAIPLTVGGMLLSATGSVDAAVILNRLRSLGLDSSAATQAYGAYTGIAQTVSGLPSAITSAVCASVIPAVAASRAHGQTGKAYLQQAFRRVGIVVWFAAALFALMPGELLALLFSRHNDVAIATPLLRLLAPATVLSSCCALLSSALHGCGEMRVPIAAMLAGNAAKILCNAILVGRSAFAICGAPIGTVLGLGIATTINGVVLAKRSGFLPPIWQAVCKPALCALAAVLVTLRLRERCLPHVAGRLATVLCLISAMLLYLLGLTVSKTLKKEDLRFLKKRIDHIDSEK